jgi:diguanylate cyclase (GGDEF)-like protein/PAS domain S-box-containing protein
MRGHVTPRRARSKRPKKPAHRPLREAAKLKAALAASEARFWEVLDNTSHALFTVDVSEDGDFRIGSINRADEIASGLRREEVVGKPLHEAFPAHIARPLQENYRRCVELGAPISYQEEVNLSVGRRTYDTSLVPLRDESGRIYRIVGSTRDVTERTETQEALHESQERLRLVSDNIPEGMIYQVDFGVDGASRAFTYLSAGVEQLHGVTVDEAMKDASAIYGQVLEEDRPLLARRETEAMVAMSTFSAEVRIRLPSGQIRWCLVTSSPRRLANNHLLWDGLEVDITARHQLEAEKEELVSTLAERVKELNCVSEVSSIIEMHRGSMSETLEEIVNALPPAWRHPEVCCARLTVDDDEHKTANYRETRWKQTSEIMIYGAQAGRIEVAYLEERDAADEGPFLRQERSLLTLVARRLGCFIERVRAEAALKESERRFCELSTIDDLTQLYNSRHFFERLDAELNRANRYSQPVALMLLDVDNFKAFNDAHGHLEGDQVLRRLGRVMTQCLRRTDSAYRYGGEEFTVLLPMTSSPEGAATAERISAEFKKENVAAAVGRELRLTLSIGVGQYRPNEAAKAFLCRVDQLMYRAKNSGKDQICCEA